MYPEPTVKVKKSILDNMCALYELLHLEKIKGEQINPHFFEGRDQETNNAINTAKEKLDLFYRAYKYNSKKFIHHLQDVFENYEPLEDEDADLCVRVAEHLVRSNIVYALMKVAISDPDILDRWKEKDSDTMQLLIEGISHALNSSLLDSE